VREKTSFSNVNFYVNGSKSYRSCNCSQILVIWLMGTLLQKIIENILACKRPPYASALHEKSHVICESKTNLVLCERFVISPQIHRNIFINTSKNRSAILFCQTEFLRANSKNLCKNHYSSSILQSILSV